MDNFFSNAFDYSMFKKAMKVTNGESIIINISSTDSSLFPPAKTSGKNLNQTPRKNMSSKFEPSPFGKFFGNKKKNSAPIDMSDFTSWKSKNYRGAEKSLDEDTTSFNHFSLTNYMQDNSGDKFNELDQARFELQKPIEQLPIDDPKLKKFSLDSYMHKLEESILAKDKFRENEDLLEPLISDDREDEEFTRVTKSINKFQQDEDFSSMDINFESFAFDDNTKGTEYSLDQDELDKVKRRLERMERHSKKNETKPTELLLPENFDVDGVDEDEVEKEPEVIDPVDNMFAEKGEGTQIVDGVDDIGKSSRGRKLNEVVINKDGNKTPNVSVKRPILFTPTFEEEPEVVAEEPAPVEEPKVEINVEPETLKKSDVLTKEDFKDITQDFMSKFSELYKTTTGKNVDEPNYQGYQQPIVPPTPYYEQPIVDQYQQPAPQQYDYQELMDYKTAHTELQMKFHELVEDKYKTDKETEEKIKKIEEERNKIDEEYKNKLKEMEENYSKKYEEFKQKMYLDKVAQEKQIKENEEKIKIRTKEENKSKNKAETLKKELKSYFDLSNLEMEKKLLEATSKVEKEENQKLQDIISQKSVEVVEKVVEVEKIVVQPTEKVIEKVEEQPKTTPKKTTKPRTRKKSRKIDRDIIGGINF
ncbi:MAG: hypothetical protein IJX17_03580 [Clostridia bacterium]|nr:hypothetical protein [Clostridia bacterium]